MAFETTDQRNGQENLSGPKMVTPKQPAWKVLYFIDGYMPTADDLRAAAEIGPHVQYRNARRIVPGAPLENCDAVAGDPANIPKDYEAVYPIAEAGMEQPEPKVGDPAYPELAEERPPPAEIVARPKPLHRSTSYRGGPDMRPGVVDTGIPSTGGTSNNTPEMKEQVPSASASAKKAAEWRAENPRDEKTKRYPAIETDKLTGDEMQHELRELGLGTGPNAPFSNKQVGSAVDTTYASIRQTPAKQVQEAAREQPERSE